MQHAIIHHYRASETGFIRYVASNVFGIKSTEGIIAFHGENEIWHFSSSGHADLKQVYQFINDVCLHLVGTIRVRANKYGLVFYILNTGKLDLSSNKL